ncbi:MAG TPA: redoxin domain-containing protein [Pyrinomonadaceae bacterium]
MKIRLRFVVCFVSASLALLACIAALAQQPSASLATKTRQSGPFVFDGVDRTDYGSDVREINLDGLKKILQRDPKDTRPLLINFWATWCDPCREEFPDLVKVDSDYRSKGLNFVAVSLDDITDIKTAVPKFLNEMKATMPVVLLNVNDPEPAIKAVDDKWDGELPATFLYDKDGKVIYRHFGKIKPDELRAALDKVVVSKQ